MAIDRKRSMASRVFERPLVLGQTFAEDGLVVAASLVAGAERIQPAGTGTALRNVLGFSALDTISPSGTRMYTVQGSVPAAAPYTLDIGHLLVTADLSAGIGDFRVYDEDATADLTAVVYGAPASGEVAFANLAAQQAGILTFHADEAGHAVSVYARVTMSAEERDQIFQQLHINSNAQAVLSTCGVWGGEGEVYTDRFDPAVDFSTGAALLLDVTGHVTFGGGGTDVSTKMRIVHSPTVADPWLGISFNL